MITAIAKASPKVSGLFFCWCLLIAGNGAARAQEVFSAGDSNTSMRTGTQGVVGNPNCPPPVEIINGKRVTPLNWSCDSSQYWAKMAPHIDKPTGPPHPGPDYVPGAANPCQPFGPGGYNWLANPVGTRLPPGCVRPGSSVVTSKVDLNYQDLPMSRDRAPPALPPAENYRRPPMPSEGQIGTGYGSGPFYRPPPMPLGQIDGPQNFRRPDLPKGQIATGKDPANTGAGKHVTYSKVDPNYEILPMSNQRPEPVPPGSQAQPDPGTLQVQLNDGSKMPSGMPAQSYRRPDAGTLQVQLSDGSKMPAGVPARRVARRAATPAYRLPDPGMMQGQIAPGR